MSSPTDRSSGQAPPDSFATPAIADRLREAAARYGTPAYVTDLAALADAATAVRDAFADPWVRQYSVKANDVTEIVARNLAS